MRARRRRPTWVVGHNQGENRSTRNSRPDSDSTLAHSANPCRGSAQWSNERQLTTASNAPSGKAAVRPGSHRGRPVQREPGATRIHGVMEAPSDRRDGWALAVHGGAGDGIVAHPPARLATAERALDAALGAGADVLRRGGPSVDAVVAAVKVLEDAPEFNAGRGAVPTRDGTVETDAAVADGRTRRAGAVAVCRGVRNPVEAARAVMERTAHVLLAGDAVTRLARQWGLALAEPAWFGTEGAGTPPDGGQTVGAVARDVDGHLAAATSTGGRGGQLAGRVGDSPVVGAGVWADDDTCAVSATGDGEAFLLAAFAHEVDALMRLTGLGVGAACDRALAAVGGRGGRGGCVVVDAAGTIVTPFTTAAVYRGWTDGSGRSRIEVGGAA